MKYYVKSKDMDDWKAICRAWCKQNSATLLFVNETSFGCKMPNGQMKHIHVDELATYDGRTYLTKNKK